MSTPNMDIISPDEATGLAQGAFDGMSGQLPFNNILPNTLLNSLPTGITADNKTVSWIPNQRTDMDKEPLFRAWDAESPYGATTGGRSVKHVEVQPLGKRHRITEADIVSAGDSAFAHDRAADYITKMGGEIAFKLEKAKLAVAYDAKLAVTENSVNYTFDYGRDKALTVTLDDDAAKWDADDVDPTEDLQKWIDLVVSKDGMIPRALVTTRKVINALRRNSALISYFYDKASIDAPKSIKEADVLNVISEFTDIQSFLIADREYETYFQTNNLRVQQMVPDDAILLLPGFGDTGIGVTGIGPTAEAMTGLVSNPDNLGLAANVQDTPGTVPAYDVYVTGSALPILAQPNSTFKATVL